MKSSERSGSKCLPGSESHAELEIRPSQRALILNRSKSVKKTGGGINKKLQVLPFQIYKFKKFNA
jgi:hypothetical protein